MWALVRTLAVLALVAIGLVLAGHGGAVLDLLDAAGDVVGAEVMVPRATAIGSPVLVAGLGVGAVAALQRPFDRAVEQLVTLLHELGHTVVAAALGARPAGIVLRHDASGHATARWVGDGTPLRRLALAAVAGAGLPAATVGSAAGARLFEAAGATAVLWALVVAGIVVAVLARSLWSLLIALSLAGVAVAALRGAAETWATGAVVAVLTATALKATLAGLRAARRPLHPGDDARVVARLLRLPARLAHVVQVAITAAFGAWTVWALLPVPPLGG